jgi:hypothetical protein
MLPLLALIGCSDAPPPITRAEVSERVTLDSMQRLGTFQLRASWTRTRTRDGASPQVRTTGVELLWQEVDDWCYSRLDGDHVESRMMVRGGAGWALVGEAPWAAGKQAETLRAQLAITWDPWDEALSLFRGHVTYTRVGNEEVAGRAAERFQLSLTPEEPPKGKKPRPKVGGPWTPTELGGDLWVDQETAVRLQASVTGVATSAGQRQEVVLDLAVSGIGQDPHLPEPGAVSATAPVAP